MALFLLLFFGLCAAALPGGLLLLGWGAWRIFRGVKQKSRRDLVLGAWALALGLVASTLGGHAVLWLHDLDITQNDLAISPPPPR